MNTMNPQNDSNNEKSNVTELINKIENQLTKRTRQKTGRYIKSTERLAFIFDPTPKEDKNGNIYINLPKDTTVNDFEAVLDYFMINEYSTYCPTCKRLYRSYWRPITTTMARCFIIFVNYSLKKGKDTNGNWPIIHLPTMLNELPVNISITGDFAKFRFQNLIEQCPGRLNDGNPEPGEYKLTDLGWQFFLNKTTIKSHMEVIKNKVNRIGGKDINIIQALQQISFNYLEHVAKDNYDAMITITIDEVNKEATDRLNKKANREKIQQEEQLAKQNRAIEKEVKKQAKELEKAEKAEKLRAEKLAKQQKKLEANTKPKPSTEENKTDNNNKPPTA